MATIPVLVVGAGPTGLNLALSLARHHVPFRIISEADGPGEHSRAMVVQARTLEFYGQFGFADEVVEQGVKVETTHLREGGLDGDHEVLSVNLNELGAGLSPYPFVLAYPQDDHERFLLGKLKALGNDVEWKAKLTGFTEESDEVRAVIEHGDGRIEEMLASYICGCDGAHSRVRETLAIGFPGGTYDQSFYVADVRIAHGFERDLYMNLGEHILSLMFPVRSNGMQRLIGLVPPELSGRQNLTFDDIRGQVEPLLDVKVTEVNWFSTYHVHHRVADRFRVRSAFLLGDAGHIHSPVGGQGMNTGIGDAFNLGWKLAYVLQGRAAPSLLDSYEPERIGFAHSLVSTTDRVFTPMIAEGLRGEFTRRVLAPLFFSVVTRFNLSRHEMFRVLSQTRIHYPESPLSQDKAGNVHGGDRLPWVKVDADDNFAPLRSLDWQAHVYGQVNKDFKTACHELNLPAHVFSWSKGADDAGMKRNAAYLVRPDGYVALALSEQSVTELKAFIDRHHLRFVASSAA